MTFLKLLALLPFFMKEEIKWLAHTKRRLRCANRLLNFLGVSKLGQKELRSFRMRLPFARSIVDGSVKAAGKMEDAFVEFMRKHGVTAFLEKHWFFTEPNDGIVMSGVDQLISLLQPLNWREVRNAARIAALLLFFVVPPMILLIDWYIVILW